MSGKFTYGLLMSKSVRSYSWMSVRTVFCFFRSLRFRLFLVRKEWSMKIKFLSNFTINIFNHPVKMSVSGSMVTTCTPQFLFPRVLFISSVKSQKFYSRFSLRRKHSKTTLG